METQVWHTLIVRVWRDGDGLKVRFLAGQTGPKLARLSLATSAGAATRNFERWLRSIELHEGAIDADTPRHTHGQRSDDEPGDDPLLASPGVEDNATGDSVRREPS